MNRMPRCDRVGVEAEPGMRACRVVRQKVAAFGSFGSTARAGDGVDTNEAKTEREIIKPRI